MSRSLDYEAFYRATNTNGKPPWIQRLHHYELLAGWTNSDGRESSRELCSTLQCSHQARTASHFSRTSSERPYTRPGSFEYFRHCIKKSSSLTSLPVGLLEFLRNGRAYSLAGKIWATGPMHSGPVFETYVTFSLPVLLNRIPQTTLRSHSRLP